MISIKKTLQRNSSADLADVYAIKKALVRTGHYQIPSYGLTPYPDESLFRAIEIFQKDKGLKVDGVIKPLGKTISSINEELEEEDIGVRSPPSWCPQCGGPHGGSKGDLCPDCDSKT